ncbi:MAG: hypothetical protein B6230_00100 [Desulfobacteraceae bacterium 4572_89]|nr:MAG: hypothetical protein B6230_00100 [Desulfobacteraceae bacterium 4572_89]
MSKKKDIMDHILAGNDEEIASRTRELDCLIYRSDEEELEKESARNKEKSWKISKDNVSVEIWESRAKIKVRLSQRTDKDISMERIASIAVDAILEELKKEG